MNAAVETSVDLAFRESRRKYLGGSDIAALLGIAPKSWRRNSPTALYFDKIEPPKVDTQNLGVKRRGKRWEGVVGEMLVEDLEAKGHKVEIVAANKRYVDSTFDFFACEVDYEIRLDGEQEITNVELKTVHPFAASDWGDSGSDETPVWYTAQCVWGLGITGRRRTLLAPLFGADEIRTYPIQAEPDLIGQIRETARKFWIENVVARVPPPPGGLVDLEKLFPKDCVPTREFADNLKFVDALAELREADADYDRAKARWDAAEFIAKQIMGDVAIATIGGEKACSWKQQTQERVDVKRLRDERPEIAAAYIKPVEFRKFDLARKRART